MSKLAHSEHEYVIVGAGPAGLQMGSFLHDAGRDYVILEGSDSPGYFFTRFPRHRTLISNNKIHTGYTGKEINLRWDWNSLLCEDDRLLFKTYSSKYFPAADSMVAYLKDFALFRRLNIKYRFTVTRINKVEAGFEVEDQHGNKNLCAVLIIATGLSKPYIPPIPGIELAELYTDVTINPDDFVGQRVLIIGKGNAGFETADNLIPTASRIHLASRHPVKMAWKSHFVGHLRAVNNNLLDTYMLKSQNALIDAAIRKIERKNGELAVTFSYAHADSEAEQLFYDRIILCTGFRLDDSIFDQTCRPETVIDDRLPLQTSEWESANLPGMYFAGTLMQMRDYKKKQSGFIHGFRYNIKMLHDLLELKYHGVPLPCRSLPCTPEAITSEIIERVNVTSALWQQTGFMCDAIIMQGNRADYYNDLTVDYVQDKFADHDHYYTVTLEFGQDRIDAARDIFEIDRPQRDDVARADLSTGIHPILRRYSRGKLVTQHHIIEDFLSEWKEEVHVKPLRDFMKSELFITKNSPIDVAVTGIKISQ